MKREENRSVRMRAENGVACIATYGDDERLINVVLEDKDRTRVVDVDGPLFLQVAAMVGSGARYGGVSCCADHGVHDGWDCPVCRPPKVEAPKALPDVAAENALAVVP
jgi:hypothetical protein